MFNALHFKENNEPIKTIITTTTPTTTTPTTDKPNEIKKKNIRKKYNYKPLNNILINFELLQKNILSIKRLNKTNIPTFNNCKITRHLSDIIENLINGVYPQSSEIDILTIPEQIIYNRIINLSNIQKKTYTNYKYIIDILKNEMIENELLINNNSANDDTIKKLKNIVNILCEFNLIHNKDKNEYITQFIK